MPTTQDDAPLARGGQRRAVVRKKMIAVLAVSSLVCCLRRARSFTPSQTNLLSPVATAALRKADEVLIARSQSISTIRCPFWRRRATDALEASAGILRFLAARHKSLLPSLDVDTARFLNPHATTALLFQDNEEASSSLKRRHRAATEVAEDVRRDFETRRYYVTGRLNLSIYADDALFDAPDPDTPVRGAKKFADALSGLFDGRRSQCDLLDLRVTDAGDIVALWRLEGVLRLPWRPAVKAFVGETTYTLDDQGLIASHLERWSIPVVDAFASVLLAPNVAATVFDWERRGMMAVPSADALRDDLDFARSLIIRPRCPWFVPKFLHQWAARRRQLQAASSSSEEASSQKSVFQQHASPLVVSSSEKSLAHPPRFVLHHNATALLR